MEDVENEDDYWQNDDEDASGGNGEERREFRTMTWRLKTVCLNCRCLFHISHFYLYADQ